MASRNDASEATPLVRMGELPVELARAAEERTGLQVAPVDAPDRRHLAVIADDEDLVGGIKVGEAKRRLARILAVGAKKRR